MRLTRREIRRRGGDGGVCGHECAPYMIPQNMKCAQNIPAQGTKMHHAHEQGREMAETSGRRNAVAAPDTAKETVPASICARLLCLPVPYLGLTFLGPPVESESIVIQVRGTVGNGERKSSFRAFNTWCFLARSILASSEAPLQARPLRAFALITFQPTTSDVR